MGTSLKIFLLMVAWDWTATASIRYIADASLYAVPIAGILTAFWWVGVSSVSRGKTVAGSAVVGAALGTYLGLRFP